MVSCMAWYHTAIASCDQGHHHLVLASTIHSLLRFWYWKIATWTAPWLWHAEGFTWLASCFRRYIATSSKRLLCLNLKPPWKICAQQLECNSSSKMWIFSMIFSKRLLEMRKNESCLFSEREIYVYIPQKGLNLFMPNSDVTCALRIKWNMDGHGHKTWMEEMNLWSHDLHKSLARSRRQVQTASFPRDQRMWSHCSDTHCFRRRHRFWTHSASSSISLPSCKWSIILEDSIHLFHQTNCYQTIMIETCTVALSLNFASTIHTFLEGFSNPVALQKTQAAFGKSRNLVLIIVILRIICTLKAAWQQWSTESLFTSNSESSTRHLTLCQAPGASKSM